MIQDLTEKALTYALIGVTLRVYSWTVFCVLLYFLFRAFSMKFRNESLKIHYLFLLAIPFFLFNAVNLSISLETTTPLLAVDIITFIGGIIMLMASLGIYFYLKGERKI